MTAATHLDPDDTNARRWAARRVWNAAHTKAQVIVTLDGTTYRTFGGLRAEATRYVLCVPRSNGTVDPIGLRTEPRAEGGGFLVPIAEDVPETPATPVTAERLLESLDRLVASLDARKAIANEGIADARSEAVPANLRDWNAGYYTGRATALDDAAADLRGLVAVARGGR